MLLGFSQGIGLCNKTYFQREKFVTGFPSGDRVMKSSLLTVVREFSCFSDEIEEKAKVRPCKAGNLDQGIYSLLFSSFVLILNGY